MPSIFKHLVDLNWILNCCIKKQFCICTYNQAIFLCKCHYYWNLKIMLSVTMHAYLLALFGNTLLCLCFRLLSVREAPSTWGTLQSRFQNGAKTIALFLSLGMKLSHLLQCNMVAAVHSSYRLLEVMTHRIVDVHPTDKPVTDLYQQKLYRIEVTKQLLQ